MKDSELLKDTRKALNLTQVEMAKRLGYVYQKEISNIETGKTNMSSQVREHLHTIRKYEIDR